MPPHVHLRSVVPALLGALLVVTSARAQDARFVPLTPAQAQALGIQSQRVGAGGKAAATGLPATVKISAYDASIYGWLEGELLQISADTLRDEVRREETYYRALIRTRNAALRTADGKHLPIIPGMQAQVDIRTGKKSVLSYLFKPVFKAREALRER